MLNPAHALILHLEKTPKEVHFSQLTISRYIIMCCFLIVFKQIQAYQRKAGVTHIQAVKSFFKLELFAYLQYTLRAVDTTHFLLPEIPKHLYLEAKFFGIGKYI